MSHGFLLIKLMLGRSIASLDRSIDRSLARSHGRSVVRSLARSIARSIARSLDRSLNRSLVRFISGVRISNYKYSAEIFGVRIPNYWRTSYLFRPSPNFELLFKRITIEHFYFCQGVAVGAPGPFKNMIPFCTSAKNTVFKVFTSKTPLGSTLEAFWAGWKLS